MRLSVSDDGIGLPQDYEARGHGFRNMRADAERMGGSLEVKSRAADGGTTVTCRIPYEELDGEERMTTDALTRVMLVDDHLIMRDLLRDALEDTGEFEVVAQAADGEEALRMAEEATPDVIVMDIIMPVMDGIEACRKITDRLPDTKVLMLTASNEKDAIVQSVGAGATGYLQKYSSKEQFLATLREVADVNAGLDLTHYRRVSIDPPLAVISCFGFPPMMD